MLNDARRRSRFVSRARSAAVPIALGLTWIASGGSFIDMRVVTETLPPVTVTAMRMVGACVVLAIPFFLRLRDPANRPTRAQVVTSAVAALLLLVCGQMMLVIGLSQTPAGPAAVFGSCSPLLLALFAWVLLGEPIGGRQLAGIALGFAGLALMAWAAMSEGGGELRPLGVAAILFSAAAWAAGSLYGERRDMPEDPVVSVTLQTIVAAVVITAIVPFTGEWAQVDLAAVPLKAWGAMAFVIATGLTLFGGFTWLNANTSGPLANTFTYVAPVLALLLGWAILSEPLTWARAAAAGVALAGVALIVSAGRGARK